MKKDKIVKTITCFVMLMIALLDVPAFAAFGEPEKKKDDPMQAILERHPSLQNNSDFSQPSLDSAPFPPASATKKQTKGTSGESDDSRGRGEEKSNDEGGLLDPQGFRKMEEDYILKKGDLVFVKIYPEDDYVKGGEMEINSEGMITLPLLGKMEVADKTTLTAEKEIAEIIDRDYLVNPSVVITVRPNEKPLIKKQPLMILGQVKRPGPVNFPVAENTFSLLQAIASAGGFTEIANIKKIKIIRQGADGGKNQVIQANADAIISGSDDDVELEPGDIINVSESLF